MGVADSGHVDVIQPEQSTLESYCASDNTRSLHSMLCSLRIHRKLKEVAVFRYIKKVDKDDGSVRILFSIAYRFASNV